MAFLLVLYIITKRDEGTYKIIWLLLVLTFPLPGALIYLIFGKQRTMKPLRKKLAAVDLPPIHEEDAEPLYAELAEADKRAAETFRTVQSMTGLPPARQPGGRLLSSGGRSVPRHAGGAGKG